MSALLWRFWLAISSTPQGLFRYSGCVSHFLLSSCLVIMQNSEKMVSNARVHQLTVSFWLLVIGKTSIAVFSRGFWDGQGVLWLWFSQCLYKAWIITETAKYMYNQFLKDSLTSFIFVLHILGWPSSLFWCSLKSEQMNFI